MEINYVDLTDESFTAVGIEIGILNNALCFVEFSGKLILLENKYYAKRSNSTIRLAGYYF